MRFLKIMILFLLGTLLVGCASKSLSGRRYTDNSLFREIAAKGVLVTKNDQMIVFKIANSGCFSQNSVNFTAKAYEILELILDFSNYYEIDAVSVVGYGQNKFIMTERARKIGKYLWHAQANTNFIYSYSDNDKDDCIVIKYSLI